jgi:hypothetical protein
LNNSANSTKGGADEIRVALGKLNFSTSFRESSSRIKSDITRSWCSRTSSSNSAHTPAHQRLKDFARARGVSLNKLVEEWAKVALAQLDAENHYRLRATRGCPEMGLALLDKIDQTLGRRSARKKTAG